MAANHRIAICISNGQRLEYKTIVLFEKILHKIIHK